MREKRHLFIAWKPGKWLLAGIALMCMLCALLPLFRAVCYTAPWYDDFSYGYFTRNFLEQENTIASALQGVIYTVKTNWYAWQGTFSSIFFMALMPAAWGEAYYFLGPLFVMVMLLIGTLVLVKTLLRDVLRAGWSYVIVLQSAAVFLIYVFIYSIYEGFYWYNGAVHYVGMHSFLLLLISMWIQIFFSRARYANVFLMMGTVFGAVLAGGANYVTALQGLLIGLSIVGLGILLKKRRTWGLLPSLLVYALAFYFNAAAPGNAVRTAALGGRKLTPFTAIFQSFQEAFLWIPKFTGLSTLMILFLLIPIVWEMTEKISFRFRFPGLLLLWSFCLYATGFTPMLYALGDVGPGRTMNAVKITFQLLLIINEVYLLGWLQKKRQGKNHIFNQGAAWWFYLAIAGVVLVIFAVEPNKPEKYSSYAAWVCVHSGEAANFRQEYLQRVETIKNGEADVTVKTLDFRPWLLYASDLSSDSQSGANRFMANWYRKNSITCLPAKTE